MPVSQLQRLEAALAAVRKTTDRTPDTALILGSGLGQLADAVADPVAVGYEEIAGFPVSTAPGHAGRLVFGRLHGREAVLMQGRFHLYEGWAPRDIALAVYLLQRLGARRLIVTNAAGALNESYGPGEVMAIADHMNFTGSDPLTGANDEAIGPRFPDLSRAYDPALRALVRAAAERAGQPLQEGIYAGVAGPSLETSAERRFYRASGADAVGMSTVHETIAAAHVGLPVIGLSAITNKATGGPDQQPDTIEEVIANAAVSGRKIAAILAELLPALPA
ncbi:purine-nucleoside phosphorylase [Aquibium sp. A9E412]|uniref:purine-nucleoside phosphorylase n=1 Tax=Aquibium sp. A9E412 TaxID=2976767 RepID=UPI0025AF3B62|nr:purine-nucleoside phosphorylase [Aquibium sp. A9E412]MDN2566662.1 purine-nucleoside phosphorylase [Aquibium sp. A9E412]